MKTPKTANFINAGPTDNVICDLKILRDRWADYLHFRWKEASHTWLRTYLLTWHDIYMPAKLGMRYTCTPYPPKLTV